MTVFLIIFLIIYLTIGLVITVMAVQKRVSSGQKDNGMTIFFNIVSVLTLWPTCIRFDEHNRCVLRWFVFEEE